MVTTVFDKTQVWPRKSILSVKSYPDLAVNHLKLIRDNFKIFTGDENLAQNFRNLFCNVPFFLGIFQ